MIGVEELTYFSMKNSLTLPSLASKYFNSLRDENDEPIHTDTDPCKRNFVRKSVGRAADAMLLINVINFKLVTKFLTLFQKN